MKTTQTHRKALNIFAAALVVAAPLRVAALPTVDGATTRIYANVTDPRQIAFAADGTMYVGRDAVGSGGGGNDAVKIHRIGPGGSPVEEFGQTAIPDPDAVVVDRTGAVSGIPGAVLVGGKELPALTTSYIKRITPSGLVSDLFTGLTNLLNIAQFTFDRSGRLLAVGPDTGDWGEVTASSVTTLGIFPPGGPGRIAADSSNRVWVSKAADTRISVFSDTGAFLFDASVGAFAGSPLAFSSSPFWGTNIYALGTNGNLLSIDLAANVTVRGSGFQNADYLIFGDDGSLYLSEFGNDRIIKITPDCAVDGATRTIYANVTDPRQIAFAADGTMYVGCDAAGSGGSPNDAVKIHRIGPGGSPVEEFGETSISDPDAVAVDRTGAISGTPGAVLVAGLELPALTTGHITKISPSGLVSVLFTGLTNLVNIRAFTCDRLGRLLAVDPVTGNWGEVTASSVTTLGTAAPGAPAHIAADVSNRVWVATRGDTRLQVFSASGSFLFSTNVGAVAGCALASSSSSFWGTNIYALGTNGNLLSIDLAGNVAVRGSGFQDVDSMTFGDDGSLYLSEFGNDRIIRITPHCTQCPSGVIAWWPADGTALDVVGTSHGMLTNGATYAPGLVGQAFSFDETNAGVHLPNTTFGPLDITNSQLTLEAWVYRTSTNECPLTFEQVIFERHSPNGYGFGLTNGMVGMVIATTANYNGGVFGGPALPTNQWIHVAGTYDGTAARVYVNGIEQASAPLTGDILHHPHDAGIGNENVSFQYYAFHGLIDELAIYNRALSTSEIAAIYGAGTNGICRNILPPTILAWPTNQFVAVGSNVTLTVTASGTLPLSYQWLSNGVSIPGATGASYSLLNAQTNHSGNYSVLVGNAYGTTTSAVATLTVLVPPAIMAQPQSTNVALGDSFALSVLATGSTPLNYYWAKAGTNLTDSARVTGSGGPVLTISNAATSDSGAYAVLVSNLVGIAQSSNASVTVTERDFPLLQEDFEDGLLDPRISIAVRGGSSRSPAIRDTTSLGSTRAFGFGKSTCGASCFWNYVTFMTVAFTNGAYVSQLSFKSIELDGDWGSAGYVFIDPPGLPWSEATAVAGFHTWSTPTGSNLFTVTLNRAVTSIVLAVEDKTTVSEIYIDDLVVQGHMMLLPPAITAQPSGRTNVVGTTATFTVVATGSEPLSYRWIKNATNFLADGGNITGATSPMLTLSNVQTGDAGDYSVVVTNAAGSTNGTIASLTIWTPCISVSADQASYPMSNGIPLLVRTYVCGTSNPLPNMTATVWITIAGTTRSNSVTTDGTGQATFTFPPLAGEAGHYEISAGLPGQPMPAPQDGFAIVGIGFGTNQVAHRLIAGVWVTNHVELRNLTDVELTGLAVTLLDAPSNVTFQAFPPATLPGYGTNTLTYVLKSTAGGADPICQMRVTSAEGATNELPVALELVPPVPQLVVVPSSLHAAMLRGAQSVATFSVANVGGAASGDLEVLLPEPEPDWLGLVTPAVIPSLAPDGQAEVAVSLTPSSGLTLGPYTGDVALWSTEAGQTDVPFQFDCVSDLKGNLRVTVVDEFTYYAVGAPKVTNATVTLLDPYVRTNITSAMTDADGVALFTNLTEAYYEVSVGAPDHGSFGTVVLVPGNRTFDLTAFLAREMVSYRWIVTTSSIPDRYIFTLETRFQTDVPAPVVRVVPGALNLCEYPAETNVVNLTVLNSGLVDAKSARLFFAAHPRFEIKPLAEYLGDIPAHSNVVVPVIIRRLGASNEGPSQIEAHLDWELPLGNNRTDYRRVPIWVYNAGLHDCDPVSPGSVPTWHWYWTGGGGGGGGGGTTVWAPGGEVPDVQPGSSPRRPRVSRPPTFGPPPDPIVPAEVGLQLSQSAVMVRQAFEALLELSNGCATPISNICVTLDIRDATNGPANDKFGIGGPELEGLSELCSTNGNLLNPGASGRAKWILVPATNAAPTNPTGYTVGGTLTFEGGQTNVIPLFPVPITVFPDARLVVDYFWERIVYSDDPFTPEVEPAVPFGVGLRMKNVGYGNALDVRITSAQPQIVDNTNGLLVEFQLVGTQVGRQSVSPSLTATLGDIAAGTNAVATWWMTASLQGQFTNYSASFTHLDDLGNGNLSLVESISNHPLVHVVRADVPGDDFVPDFLVSDGYLTNTLPDNLYLSEGSVAPVGSITNGVIDGPPGPGHTNVLLTASLPPGWAYLRITNPAPGIPLTFVRRSDDRYLLLGWNVWTTYRVVHPTSGPPYEESYLHLLDYNGTGSNTTNSYTLAYNVALYIIKQPQSRTNVVGETATFSVQAGGTQPFSYRWLRFGTNLVGETNATLTITDVRVGDAGPYSVIVSNVAGELPSAEAWLTVWVPPMIIAQPQNSTNLVGTAASFTVTAEGTTPLAYQWFKFQTNALPNETNATLVIPNVQTNDRGFYRVEVSNVAGVTNSTSAYLKVLVPPQICPVARQYATVGRPLVVTNCAVDEDEPIIFSLGVKPAGATITTNGIFRWTPACDQGSSTNMVQVLATDSDTTPSSSSMTFTVIVTECIEAALGQTNVLAGQTSAVPVRLLSTVALTNMAFTVVYPAERFTTNFTLTVYAPQVLTQWLELLAEGQVRVSFTLPADIILYGPTNVGELGFAAVSNQSSAFVPFPLIDVTGLKPSGEMVGNAFGYPGRVVVVGPEPLLEPGFSTNAEPILILYSAYGSTNVLESRLSLSPGLSWQDAWPVVMPSNSLSLVITNVMQTNQMIFYRARRE